MISEVRMFGPVIALQTASTRTKNRVREHADLRPDQIMPDGGARRAVHPTLGESILFACHDEGCDWLGWLPVNEIAEA